MRKKQAVPESTVRKNNALLNVVAPIGMSFTKNTLTVGENIAKIYGVTKYPAKVGIGWLSSLTGLSDTIVTIGFEPCNNSDLLNTISRNIKTESGRIETSNDPLEANRAAHSVEDNTRLIEQIDHENETVGFVTLNIMALSDDENKFKKICRKVESSVVAKRCKIRSLPNLQKESFKAISPSFPAHPKINGIIHRIMPMTTLMGGIPFAAAGFADENGYYFAKDHLGGLIMLDPWYRGGDRTNSNFVILGPPGTGKSTAMKAQLILNEYMMGTKIIAIDPESELKDLCRYLKGDWINAAGGTKGLINPFQATASPKDDDNDDVKLYVDEGMGLNDLALHIKDMEVWVSLYLPSLSDIQMAILKKEIIALYRDFSITWSTNIENLSAKDYPIISDLYERINKKTDESNSEHKIYRELAALIFDAAEGADSFLWNGHSTIDSDTQFMCLDTSALLSAREEVKRSHYFLLLKLCWEIISRNRGEKVMLICDEAYLMIDPQVPETLIFLRNVAKRIRKYEGSLVVIFHSLIDVLSPPIRMYGQALLDNPCYRIIFGADGQNLKDITELYNLTEAEQEFLTKRRRGDALFVAGGNRMKIHFDIHQYKLDCLGKAAGR